MKHDQEEPATTRLLVGMPTACVLSDEVVRVKERGKEDKFIFSGTIYARHAVTQICRGYIDCQCFSCNL